MTARYAEGTKVAVEVSQAELIGLLRRHGATQTAVANDRGRAVVIFALGGRQVRLEISMPSVDDIIKKGAKDQPRVDSSHWWSLGDNQKREWAKKQLDQIERQRWRALILITKGKLELVADGMSTIEREFLADIVLPNGQTVHEALAPRLAAAYQTGDMPPLLPAYGGT